MFYSVSHNAIASISAGYKQNDFSGSSSYKVVNQQIIKKTREQKPITHAYSQAGENTSVGVQSVLGIFDEVQLSNSLPAMPIGSFVRGHSKKKDSTEIDEVLTYLRFFDLKLRL